MKLITYAVPVLVLLLSFFYNTNPFIVKEEAHQAYDYLNTIRLHPEQFYDSLHIDSALHVQKCALLWNDKLAKAAEEKAIDMARNGYAADTVSMKLSDDNYFESAVAGSAGGDEAIRSLIIDQNVPTMANRNHLLGIGVSNSNFTDVGIGYVRCDAGKYRSYACIIVAKHH
jgi:hypothetical protein